MDFFTQTPNMELILFFSKLTILYVQQILLGMIVFSRTKSFLLLQLARDSTQSLFLKVFISFYMFRFSPLTWVQSLQKPEEGNRSHGTVVRIGLLATMWMIGIGPKSSGKEPVLLTIKPFL